MLREHGSGAVCSEFRGLFEVLRNEVSCAYAARVTRPRALIFGVSGQDGPWVARDLGDAGYQVFGTHLTQLPPDGAVTQSVALDLMDEQADVRGLIESVAPSVVVFLAGRSSVAESWKDPAGAMRVNAASYARILDAVRDIDPTIRVVHASSSEMYGDTEGVIDESTPLRPNSPYAESKAVAHRLGVEARERNGMNISNAILTNHESVRRPLPYVFRRISVGVAALALGFIDELVLGDLDVVRDWGHAPDYAQAMVLMALAPDPGDYVIATGVSVSLRDVVASALAWANLDDRWDLIALNPDLARRGSSYAVRANPAHIGATLGWQARDTATTVVSIMVAHDSSVLSEQGRRSDVLLRLA